MHCACVRSLANLLGWFAKPLPQIPFQLWDKQAIDSRVLSALVVLVGSSSCRPQQLRTIACCQIHKSTYQYRPSLIPKESCTHLILPPNPNSFVAAFSPPLLCLEDGALARGSIKTTTQQSSTDPTLLCISCSQTCPPSLSSPPSGS